MARFKPASGERPGGFVCFTTARGLYLRGHCRWPSSRRQAMSSNVICFGWNRSVPGRERMSAEHFQAFGEYLATQQRKGAIDSFEPVFLDPHGGELNGFFLIRGDSAKLDSLMASDDWTTHTIRALV